MTRRTLTTAAVVTMAAVAASAGAQNYKCFDDGEVALVAIPDGGVLEPAIPLFLHGVRVDNPDTGGPDFYTILDFYDRVPGTGSYPLTAADIIANGFIRPLVQRADGTTSAIGTSIVTGPSFRETGHPLDLIPDMLSAEITAGQPDGEDRIAVTAHGLYADRASLTCQRRWPDPAIGRTETVVEYEWEAAGSIPLPGDSTGRGFDAFRLIMFSSMLSSLQTLEYDARFIEVVDPQGRRRTLELRDNPRPRYLFPSPRPVAVGGAFALLKDNRSVWNPGSPSIEIVIESVSVPVGQLGVQGYLAASTDHNDDSLSVWLEWVDAPAVVPAGTRIGARFRIIATPATDPGDLDHDGAFTTADGAMLYTRLGAVEADPDFDAYADINRDRAVTDADYGALAALLGADPADLNRDGAVNTIDVLVYLTLFASGDPSADLNGDGLVNTIDVLSYLNLYAYAR